MKTLLHPLPGFLLVKPLTQDSQGFIFSDTNSEAQVDGEVVEVGASKPNEYFSGFQTTDLKPGDKIVHRAYGKESYKFEGVSYRFVLFKDCVGIIK